MLGINILSKLVKKLQFGPANCEWYLNYASCIIKAPLKDLFQINMENGPVLCQCDYYLQKISEKDFRFDWEFNKERTAFFQCTREIFKAKLASAIYCARINDLDRAVLKFIDLFSNTKQSKDLNFFLEYRFDTRCILDTTLGFLHPNRNKFSYSMRRLIILGFLNTINRSISDTEIINRDQKYCEMFKNEFIAETKEGETWELQNCPAEQIESMKQYYSNILEDLSKPTPDDHLKRLKNCLMNVSTEILLTIMDLALKGFQEQHSDYPNHLDQLVPEFLPSMINDPYSGSPFLYKRINKSSYIIHSAELTDTKIIENLEYHPLKLVVKSDQIQNDFP